jgi:hypothetical protein
MRAERPISSTPTARRKATGPRRSKVGLRDRLWDTPMAIRSSDPLARDRLEPAECDNITIIKLETCDDYTRLRASLSRIVADRIRGPRNGTETPRKSPIQSHFVPLAQKGSVWKVVNDLHQVFFSPRLDDYTICMYTRCIGGSALGILANFPRRPRPCTATNPLALEGGSKRSFMRHWERHSGSPIRGMEIAWNRVNSTTQGFGKSATSAEPNVVALTTKLFVLDRV